MSEKRRRKSATEKEVLEYLTSVLREEEEGRAGEKFKAAELLCRYFEQERKRQPGASDGEAPVVIIDDLS